MGKLWNRMSETVVLSVVTALGIVGVIISLLFGKQIAGGLDTELFRITYQFLLLTVVGAAFSFVYQEFNRSRELQQARRFLLRDMHTQILAGYNDAKKSRRHLRARVGDIAIGMITRDVYQQEIERLIDVQLLFELYATRMDEDVLWFRDAKELLVRLRKIESYLNGLIDEYEKKLNTFSDEDGIPVEDLPKLSEFIGPYSDAVGFKAEFKYPMKEVLQAMGSAQLI